MSQALAYQYGVGPPCEAASEIREQMWLAHQYRNTLVAIERGHRAALRALENRYGDMPSLEGTARDASEVTRAAYVAVKAAKAKMVRKKGAKRQAAAPQKLEADKLLADLQATLTAARANRKVALEALGAARKALRQDPTVKVERAAIEKRGFAIRKLARQHSRLHYGTYLRADLADSASRAFKTLPLYKGAEPNDPKFRRWNGEGGVAVQVQKGASVADVMGGRDTRLRIEPGTPPPRTKPNSRRSQHYRVLALRIGSVGKRKAPKWARFPLVLHRPLPPGARIKEAAVVLRRIGTREEWTVSISVDRRAVVAQATNGSVGIDIGWRKVAEGWRVAAWRGSDGAAGQLVLPTSLMDRYHEVGDEIKKSVNRLHSIRIKNFNLARDRLVAQLQRLRQTTPEWLTRETCTLERWKSFRRLAGLACRWRTRRFTGDATAYSALERWRYNDQHLWCWEANQRKSAERNRREVYRLFAVKMATRYSTLKLERFDLRDVLERDVAGDNPVARRMRVFAATSTLRDALKMAFLARGGTVEAVEAADTTRRCAVQLDDGSVCGSIETWDQATEIEHRCSLCGTVWDQDDNAAVNILAREPVGDDEKGGGARTRENQNDPDAPRESRWARIKRLKKEKMMREQAAREADASHAG